MGHSFDQGYWDQVWRGDRGRGMTAAPPNPHLVREVGDLTPGTALDAGCGAGTEAIWLAGRGWQVTGADIAPDALARAAERADVSGVAERLRWVEADLAAWEPESRYDLVTTHYAHPAIPQLEFYDQVARWVAPAGTLLVVAHLQGHGSHKHGRGAEHKHERGHGHAHGHDNTPDGGGPPRSASVTAADITARLDPAAWEVRTALETRRTMPGPGGRGTSVDDVVVRAVRRR